MSKKNESKDSAIEERLKKLELSFCKIDYLLIKNFCLMLFAFLISPWFWGTPLLSSILLIFIIISGILDLIIFIKKKS